MQANSSPLEISLNKGGVIHKLMAGGTAVGVQGEDTKNIKRGTRRRLANVKT